MQTYILCPSFPDLPVPGQVYSYKKLNANASHETSLSEDTPN